MKKLTYEYVKSIIEKENHQLLSKKWINSKNKIEIKCLECNNIFYMYFYSFKNGQRCPKCGIIKKSNSQKLNYDHVKSYINSFDYDLISNEYVNAHTNLKVQCDKGHKYEVKWFNFKKGHRCPECFGTKKSDIGYIKSYFKKEGFTLLSDEYNNAHDKLSIVCNKGHKYEVKFNNFQQGKRCPICNLSNITSKGEKEVLDYIKSNYSGKIIENDRNTIINPLTNNYLELDIFLPDINLAIEFNGGYWHSLSEVMIRDDIKKKECKKLNINLIIIEESEWNLNNTNEKERIKNFIKKENVLC